VVLRGRPWLLDRGGGIGEAGLDKWRGRWLDWWVFLLLLAWVPFVCLIGGRPAAQGELRGDAMPPDLMMFFFSFSYVEKNM
jgi:hypothetical protein